MRKLGTYLKPEVVNKKQDYASAKSYYIMLPIMPMAFDACFHNKGGLWKLVGCKKDEKEVP